MRRGRKAADLSTGGSRATERRFLASHVTRAEDKPLGGCPGLCFARFRSLPGRYAGGQDPDRGPGCGATLFLYAGRQGFAKDQIIVKLDEGATQSDLATLNRRNDARTEEDLPRSDVNVVDLPSDLPVQEAVRRYEASPAVEYAEPDFLLQPTKVPNDPYFKDYLYGLNNNGQTGGTPDADIDAPEAWDGTTGAASTVVAVIDQGADISHPDLKDNVWVNADEVPGNGVDDDNNGYVDDVNGYDFFNDDATVYDPDPISGKGDEHGTHVSGTIAASGNNSTGITGGNWQARIMVLKFLGPNVGYTSDAVEALNYAVANGAKISNNSWGGGGKSQALQDAIANADGKGHLFVAAAGNRGSDAVGDDNDATTFYPASYGNPNIISVAATDDEDRLASFSNYGDNSVDLGAPGVSILSTLPGGSYGWYSGTSMAAPHVSGVVALLKSQNPGLDDGQMKSRILQAVDGKSSLSARTVSGGRLNAAQALGIKLTELSFATQPRVLTYGQATVLSGRLTSSGDPVGGQKIVLKQRPVGARNFSNLDRITTAADGTFRLSGAKPAKHTDYRALFPGNNTQRLAKSASAAKRVNVRAIVTLATATTKLQLGKSRAVSGAVRPYHGGGAVTVFIKRNGDIIDKRKIGLSDSRYRFIYKPERTGTYAFFATYPKHTDHLGDRSPQKKFKVVK